MRALSIKNWLPPYFFLLLLPSFLTTLGEVCCLGRKKIRPGVKLPLDREANPEVGYARLNFHPDELGLASSLNHKVVGIFVAEF